MGNAPETLLNIGPVEITLRVSEAGNPDRAREATQELAEDFRLFQPRLRDLEKGQTPFDFRLECRLPPDPDRLRKDHGWRLFKYQGASSYGWGPRRLVLYDDGAAVQMDHRTGKAWIWAGSKERLHELAYLLILSKAGEILDSLGLHRVHGLGISVPSRNHASLFMMDSGVGKTTLALSLGQYFKAGEIEFYSDEIPVIDGRWIHPFPIRAALSEGALRLFPPRAEGELRPFRRMLYSQKFLLPLNSIGPVASPRPLRSIFICERSAKGHPPEIRPTSRLSVFFRLFGSCVVGMGTPQMSEHLLRFDLRHLVRLIRIAFSRLIKSLELSWRSDCYRAHWVDDPEKNAYALEKWLKTSTKSAPRPLMSEHSPRA